MTLDERPIDERMAQITKTLREQAAAGDQQSRRIEGLILSHELLALDLKSLSSFVAEIGVGTARLLRAVEAHETRIDSLEDDRQHGEA